jgi:pimeloyl-ACP methyl ester carboxylesterase
MTIASTTRKAGPFTGDGIVTGLPFAFKVFSAADLLVVQARAGVETTKVLTTDYTVALNADQNATPGGMVNMLAAAPVGTTTTLSSQVANAQATDLTNAGGFYPRVINDALDRATIQIQQLAEKLSRALQLPISSTASGALPVPVANNLLGWDNLGQAIVNYAGVASSAVSAAMAPVVASATLALARASLSVADFITQTGRSRDFGTAVADRNLSIGASRAAHEDFAVFSEGWASLAAWTVQAGSTISVSAGVLRNGNAGATGANSAANHSYALTGTQHMLASFNVKHSTTDLTAGLIIGTSDDAAGAIPVANGASATGIFISGLLVYSFNKGATSILGTAASGDYTLTITVDDNYVTYLAVKSDQSTEFQYRVTRASVTINNLFVFNSYNTNAVDGIKALVARKSITPPTPVQIAGVSHSPARYSYWTQTLTADASIRIMVPPAYDPRIPRKAVILFHGNAANENVWSGTGDTGHAPSKSVAKAFLDGGYIVVGASYPANLSTWGAQAGLDAYYKAYRLLRENFAVGPIVLYGNSMGGIESLLTLAEARIPGVVAWIGTNPTANLATNYANATFTALIKTAYGIAADGSDYASKTVGHDPLLKSGYEFRGVPMLFIAATDDTTVPKVDNTDRLITLVTPYAASVTLVPITGGHDPILAPYTAQMVTFADAYVQT